MASLCPDALWRAYADDLAGVLACGVESAQLLAPLFADFERLSGLHLNLPKTAILPLWPVDPPSFLPTWAAAVPLWAAARVTDKAKYLGFYLGPGKGVSSCKGPSGSMPPGRGTGASSGVA